VRVVDCSVEDLGSDAGVLNLGFWMIRWITKQCFNRPIMDDLKGYFILKKAVICIE
jgi:hypothetical protein